MTRWGWDIFFVPFLLRVDWGWRIDNISTWRLLLLFYRQTYVKYYPSRDCFKWADHLHMWSNETYYAEQSTGGKFDFLKRSNIYTTYNTKDKRIFYIMSSSIRSFLSCTILCCCLSCIYRAKWLPFVHYSPNNNIEEETL